MMRVAKKGTTLIPVEVRKSTPKEVRQGTGQYVAMNIGTYGHRVADLVFRIGEGDTIEEAVDALSVQL